MNIRAPKTPKLPITLILIELKIPFIDIPKKVLALIFSVAYRPRPSIGDFLIVKHLNVCVM